MILAEDANPFGTLQAWVEDDGRTVYLYMGRTEGGLLSAVWVANRLPAPEHPDSEAPKEGMAPLMPRARTRHPQGMDALSPDELSLVWLEEGDGVALLHQGRILGVLPGWSACTSFPGYAAEAVGEGPEAWALAPAEEVLGARVEAAARFWEWRSGEGAWPEIQEAGLGHLERRLGPHQAYFAADGGRFPPRAVVRFRAPGSSGADVYCTVGMSAHPMPRVELAHEDPSPFRRVELALGAAGGEARERAAILAGLTEMPWRDLTWLGHGHTAEFGGQGVVLLQAPPPHTRGWGPFGRAVPAPDLSGAVDRSGDPVNYLWVVPITPEELALAQSEGSAALHARLEKPGRGWIWPR